MRNNALQKRAPPKPFNTLTNKQYYKVKLASYEAILRSNKVSLGRYVQKSDVLTHAQELTILPLEKYTLNTPQSLNNKFIYLCNKYLFNRTRQEMKIFDFSLHNDLHGHFLRYFLYSCLYLCLIYYHCNCLFQIFFVCCPFDLQVHTMSKQKLEDGH